MPSAPLTATNGLTSTDAEMSEAGHSPSPADLPTQPNDVKPDPDIKQEPHVKQESTGRREPGAVSDSRSAGQAAFKQEASQRAQHGLAAEAILDRQEGGRQAVLKQEEEGAGQGAEDIAEAGVGEDGDAEGQGSDDESAEGQRLTRSRRSNAAGLYMLDHGSQLVPKKVSTHLFFLHHFALFAFLLFLHQGRFTARATNAANMYPAEACTPLQYKPPPLSW